MAVELYKVNMSEEYDVPARDELIADVFTPTFAGKMKISTAGEYVRGELMMSGTGGFVSATKDGLASAEEICILCEDLILPDGQYAEVVGYFGGRFKAESVILPYETVDSVHAEELAAIEDILRKHKIFIS